MALPLPVSPGAIQDPIERPVLAVLRFQIEGTDVPYLDAYQSGDVAGAEQGIIEAVVRYQAQQGARASGPGADLFGGLVPSQVSPDFFESRQETPGLQITFTWSDLASFMWFEPFEEIEAAFAEDDHQDFFSGTDAASGDDVFSPADPVDI